MKINSNENVLLMNKNVRKMGAEPIPTPETTVSNPENTMKAMNVLGQQNISFQGGTTKLAQQVVNKSAKGNIAKLANSKAGKGAMVLAVTAMLAGLASCEKETNIDIDVTQDNSAIAAAFTSAMQGLQQQLAALTVLVANMQTQQAVQTEVFRQQLTTMDNMYKEVCKMRTELEKQGKTQEEIKASIDNYCIQAIAQMQTIASLLGTDSPIYQKVSAIYEEYVSGKKSAQEAYEAMMKVLNSIDSKMDVLIGQNEDIKSSLDSIMTNQVNLQNLTEEQKEAFLKAADEIKAEIEAGNINDNNYYQASYKHWFAEDAQRAVMIQVLVKNGYTEEKAVKYLEELNKKATESEEKAKVAFEELMSVLNNIDTNVGTILEKLTEFVNKYSEDSEAYKKYAKEITQIAKEIRNGTNANTQQLAALNFNVSVSSINMQKDLNNIAKLIKEADVNNVEAMTQGKEEIISVLKQLGYEEQEIIKMSKEEIVSAIEKGNQYVQNNGAVLSKILSYVAILPQIRDAGYTTNTKIDKIINKMDNLEIGVEISPETLAELEAFFEANFGEFKEILNDINNNITKQGENTSEELKKINANVNVIKGDVKEIKENSAIQIAYDQYILEAINNVGAGVTNIEEIAAQIGVDVSWIREHGGGQGGTVDLTKVENYLKQEIANTDAINAKLDLMLAAQSKDSDKMDEALKYLKSLDSTTKSILDTEKNFKDIVIAEFASFGIKMDENNEWLEKIYNKKCNCAKDVTIIVEKIYKYLVDGNEGIVDYDDLFDDLFGDDEGTKAVAMATPQVSSADINKLIMVDNAMHLANVEHKIKHNGQPLPNGRYSIGNITYTVSGDLSKTMSVADFYKIAAEKMNQA